MRQPGVFPARRALLLVDPHQGGVKRRAEGVDPACLADEHQQHAAEHLDGGGAGLGLRLDRPPSQSRRFGLTIHAVPKPRQGAYRLGRAGLGCVPSPSISLVGPDRAPAPTPDKLPHCTRRELMLQDAVSCLVGSQSCGILLIKLPLSLNLLSWTCHLLVFGTGSWGCSTQGSTLSIWKEMGLI